MESETIVRKQFPLVKWISFFIWGFIIVTIALKGQDATDHNLLYVLLILITLYIFEQKGSEL